MKRLFIILLVIILLSGCNNKDNVYFTIECEKEEYLFEGSRTTLKAKGSFDINKNIIEYKNVIKDKLSNKEELRKRQNEYKNILSKMENENGKDSFRGNIEVNETDYTVALVTYLYNVENNKANIFLDFYESNMYTCKIDGINKEEIYK